MIRSGDHVAYLNGNTEYVATRTNNGWDERKFTIQSVKTGRRKYNVRERDLIKWEERKPVSSVKTTQGRVRRPRNWKSFDSFAGGARRTWIGEKWVFKKGHSEWGESRCAIEACRYFLQSGGDPKEAENKFGRSVFNEARYYDDVPVAECYLLEDGTLMMERVLPVRSLQRGSGAPSMTEDERRERGFHYGGRAYPDWSRKVDSDQIGINAKGELVAYDL